MNRKMIVVDLDGTLLNINAGCSKKTKKYLKKLKDMGHIVVIATGRILRDAVSITDGAEFSDYVISNSGGLIYDMNNKKIIRKSEISCCDILNVFKMYNNDFDYITLGDLYYYYRYGDDSYKMDYFYDKKITNINDFINLNKDVFHMVVKFKNNDLVPKYYELLKNDNIEVIIMQNSYASRKWLEIFGRGVSKYNGIKEIMDIEGISNSDVISFGDGGNDIDMIENSGIGVAMGNALDSVKNVADYITISHNEDGVIYFLRGYFKENDLVG